MNEKRLYGIRGATCVCNTRESILEQTELMCRRLFWENELTPEDIVSIQFSVTEDVDAMNPAAALRQGDCGINILSCALFCSQEPKISNSLSHVIRVLVTAYRPFGVSPCHVYQNGAEQLRPDFIKGI